MDHKEFLYRLNEYFNRDIMPPLDPSMADTPVENYDAEEDVFPDDMEDLDENTSPKVLKDIANLASGTIGSLVDTNKMSTLDKIQDEFYNFAKSSKENFKSWQDAWNKWGAWYPEIQGWGISQDPKKAEYNKGSFTVVVDKKAKTWDLYKGNSKTPIDAGKVNPEAIKGVLKGVKQLYK